jgi:hypothetical protein
MERHFRKKHNISFPWGFHCKSTLREKDSQPISKHLRRKYDEVTKKNDSIDS